MTTSAQFRRCIFRDYPVRLLPEELRAEFDFEALVVVTVEALRGIGSGETFVEAIFGYQDGAVVQQSERVLTWP